MIVMTKNLVKFKISRVEKKKNTANNPNRQTDGSRQSSHCVLVLHNIQQNSLELPLTWMTCDSVASSSSPACTQFPLFLRSHPVTQTARKIRSNQSIRHPSRSASPMFELWRAAVFPTCSEQIVNRGAHCYKYAGTCWPAVRREVLINSC